MELVIGFVKDLIGCFDIGYMLSVNVATYVLIKIADNLNGVKEVPTWLKRVAAVCIGVILGLVNVELGVDKVIIFNSFFISLVSWDCIFKPVLNILNEKFNYKKK